MNKIKVESLSSEEVDHGVTELWADGVPIAYTVYADDGELMLRIPPNRDGSPVMIGVRELADALSEVNRVLSLH
jgi:hypothetical protein